MAPCDFTCAMSTGKLSPRGLPTCQSTRYDNPSWPSCLPVYRVWNPSWPSCYQSTGNTTPRGLTCCRSTGNKTPRGLPAVTRPSHWKSFYVFIKHIMLIYFFQSLSCLTKPKFIAYLQLASKICLNCTNLRLFLNQCTFSL